MAKTAKKVAKKSTKVAKKSITTHEGMVEFLEAGKVPLKDKKTIAVAKLAKVATKVTKKPVEVQKIPMGMTAKKAAKALAKLTHSEAPVVEKSTKVAKSTKKAVAKKAVAKSRAPNPVIAACIELMLRKEGAGIADFQKIEGFNLPSMAVVKAARRAGYEADADKKPGERTVYKAVKGGSQ
jgi:hypothetical protein